MIKDILFYTFTVGLPIYFPFFLLYSKLFDKYDKKLTLRNVILFSIFYSLVDSILNKFVPKDIYDVVGLLAPYIFLVAIFKFNPISCFISFLGQTVIYVVNSALIISGFDFIFKITLRMAYDNWAYGTLQVLTISLSYFLYTAIILKLKFKIRILSKYDILSNETYEKFLRNNILSLIPSLSIIIIMVCVGFYNYYSQVIIHKSNDSHQYLIIAIACLLFTGAVFILSRKIFILKNIELEYNMQKSFLKNINHLYKGLHEQKKGFANQLNIINGLLEVNQQKEAQEYIRNAGQAIKIENQDVNLFNTTISGIINSRVSDAELKHIKMTVNNTIQYANFNTFDAMFAIDNVIDFVFDFLMNSPENERMLQLNFYTNERDFIFEFHFRGKRLSNDCLGDPNNQLHLTNIVAEYHCGSVKLLYEQQKYFDINKIVICFPKGDRMNEVS